MRGDTLASGGRSETFRLQDATKRLTAKQYAAMFEPDKEEKAADADQGNTESRSTDGV